MHKVIPSGSLLLVAFRNPPCAGSGKTEVVARRVVHLLSPGEGEGLAPRNIIAFTFTDKAAAELKERIITHCREALGEVPGLAEMFVGTIHAFFTNASWRLASLLTITPEDLLKFQAHPRARGRSPALCCARAQVP